MTMLEILIFFKNFNILILNGVSTDIAKSYLDNYYYLIHFFLL